MAMGNVTAIIASAGAGKTTRIVSEIVGEVVRREPERILATTFTTKAADELVERSRAALYSAGMPQEAARLLGARFGTVNAICGRIVSENAIALGRSPGADVIPDEDISKVFAIAADEVIERHAPRLNALADAMGFFEPRRAADAERTDWRTTVRRIIELMRSNGISVDDLPLSAARSVAPFEALLPPLASESAAVLDGDLARAIEIAIALIPDPVSATARSSVETLRRVAASIGRGDRLSWPDWARLSKVGCAKKDGGPLTDAMQQVCRAAGRHPEHPRLREECSEFITAIFSCAAEALSSFQQYKAERGLLDFTDQEALALQVLDDPALSADLGELIELVFVDEFQDSSPLQIAIFAGLSRLVEGSTWVGDPKQAIYGFRNADSLLTQAAFAGVATEQRDTPEVLATSYRSRSGIVDFVNAAFAPALAAMGLPGPEHRLDGTARSEVGFMKQPLSVWWLEGKLEQQYEALAAKVRDLVAGDVRLEVGTKSGSVRPIRPGDIAILCRSRADVAKASMALARHGLRVAVERERLCRTPHVEMVLAALRWVVDPSDRLALAEMARFFSDEPESDHWLRALAADDGDDSLRALIPICERLVELRASSLSLTPAEIVDAIVMMPELKRTIESWGDPAGRLDDIEALRGSARVYEKGCRNSGVAATASGLVLSLAESAPARPRSLRDDAVRIMTYHGAKGLEWPMVVMTGLGKEPAARFWEPVVEADGEIDWRDPLAGRWIRYWPWPFASLSRDVHLDSAAAESPLGLVATKRMRDEEARLLYVGATRARDYLVLAPPAKGDLHWLSMLDGDGPDHVVLPRDGRLGVRAGDETFPADVLMLSDAQDIARRKVEVSHVRSVRMAEGERSPLVLRPSSAAGDKAFVIAERLTLGPRLQITGTPHMASLGDAVHAILAADRMSEDFDTRLTRAGAILDRWQVPNLDASEVLAAGDRLAAEIARRWPAAKLYREAPVTARVGEQLVRGRIDLLVEHEHGLAIIDHKSFPGKHDTWDDRAIGYGHQLALYARAIEQLRSGSECQLYVHMPIVGALLRVASGNENLIR
jgi:ATP-dependent helicase/nuclease subunit A